MANDKPHHPTPCFEGELPPLCSYILRQIDDRLSGFEDKLSNGFAAELREHALQIQSLREEAKRRTKLAGVIQVSVTGVLVVGGFTLLLHLGHQYLDAQETRLRTEMKAISP